MSSDSLKLLSYDFEFITRSLGLIPIGNHNAINPGAIISLEVGEDRTVITLHGEARYFLDPEDMAKLEETIKRRNEEAKQLQREAVKENILAQHEIVQELNNRVAAPPMILGMPGKKGRN